ncbi:40S ribosomal protein S12 [Salpingoeca rosetta]|uniref:40S ribosomal protein S12 n=1 Tax=Salpingoeca rosetta (strain ATCC 50818 / BSB-021) TaxID=946362 RepID=F2TWG0_SALR5|nr:40S ribosomal protein S12 [Salpingoeca rosetta]EGD72406.1 40S ribosomal protein S12 [Salpingoeca rosetta]|eukprot:XP_004998975.1 40S ribosomal protein S12 [Salpingoeca rosetta]
MAEEQQTMDTTPEQVETPAVEAELTNEEALRLVLRDAVHSDGIVRGLREVAKTISRGDAIFAVVANDCDEKNITKLIEALCAERKVPFVTVESKKQLGEWAGLCKIDKDGNPRKVVKCSCVAVKALPDSRALAKLRESLKA